MSSDVTQSAGFYDFLAWLEINKKKVIVAAVIALGVGSAIAIYRWQVNQAELQANAALLKLQVPPTQATPASAPGSDAFLKIAGEFRNTSAGERALLLGASALFQEGKYAEAQKRFDQFLSEYSGSLLAPEAAFGSAAALDAQDKTNEALAAYQNITARHPTAAVSAQAKLALARLNESRNKPEDALKIYDEFTKPGMASVWSSEAAMWREQLLAKFPQLKPEAPAPSSPKVTITRVPGTNSGGTNQPKINITPVVRGQGTN